MMARYQGHHSYGTGINRKGIAIPLQTGTSVHEPVDVIASYCKKRRIEEPEVPTTTLMDELIDQNIVRDAIEDVNATYVDIVDKTGLKQLTEIPEDIDALVTEQCTLVGGLVWTWVLELLPWVLDHYEIIAVEQEFERILACTCGLGEIGDAATHEERGCNGVCLMTRPDLILRHLISGILVYVELKTGADVKNKNYEMQYEDNIQFALGAAAVEYTLGEPIQELYVHALHKGKRSQTKNFSTGEWEGPKKQNSSLCYVFYKEDNPPLEKGDIRPNYYTTDPETGRRWGATIKRGYYKTPLWEVPLPGHEPGVPYFEHWVRNVMDAGDLLDHYAMIGPIKNPHFLVERLVVEMAEEELRWQQRLDYLDVVLEECAGDRTHQDFQHALMQVIPRSWKCYNYGGWCEYQTICFQREGWDDPLGEKSDIAHAKYERRTPNHPIEINAEGYKNGEADRTESGAGQVSE